MINSMKLFKIVCRGFAKKQLKVKELPIEYDPETAFRIVKAHSYVAFNESLNLCVKLGIDPKRSDLSLRGSVVLPAGIGRSKRIAFFGADEEQNQVALNAGADLAGTQDILAQIKEGVFDFEVLYATVESINLLKPYARLLGPKGLFPNAKVNTLIKADEIRIIIRSGNKGC